MRPDQMTERCAVCPIRDLPECGGSHHPELCSATPHRTLKARSRYYSSTITGWPAPPPRPDPPPIPSSTNPPPPDSSDSWLAPLRGLDGSTPDHRTKPWEGRQPRKPWDYPITAVIPHLDQPEILKAVLATLRAQTERPYLMVIDAGSQSRHRRAIEALEGADDLEVHYLRPTAWRWTSEPVAVAMDLAFARCQSPYLYGTHVDVFLRRPDYLSDLLVQCDERTPVVGYQMSDRSFVPGCGNAWETIPSHTASLYHMPTMRRINATWNMAWGCERLGIDPAKHISGWPDTETALGLVLQDNGIGVRWPGDPSPQDGDPASVLFLGPEPNEPYTTPDLVHCRSHTAHGLYDPARARARRANLMAEAQAAIDRAASWIAARNA